MLKVVFVCAIIKIVIISRRKTKEGGIRLKNRAKERIAPITTKPSGGKPAESAKAPASTPDTKQKPSVASVIIKIAVSVSALILAAVFTSLLFVDYNFEYISSPLPESATAAELAATEGHLTEDDIPPPVYVPVYYDFTQPVPESAPVTFDYFNDTVFVGDSRTKGLLMFTDIKPYDFSSVGLNVASLSTQAFIRMRNENNELQSYTLFEALEREKGKYKAIYVATGLNELGWPSEGYMDAFDTFIKNIRAITDVPIYVQLIMPVTTHSSETTKYGITNEKCVIFNELLRDYAAKNELFMLDPLSLFTLEDGTLSPDHSADGIHLNRASCAILAEYYRTHVVNIYDYENTRPAIEEENIYHTDENTEQ